MAFNGTSTTDFFPVLKEWTEDFDTINKLLFEDNPLFGLMPTNPNVEGKYITVPMMVSGNAGYGANFANALANQTSGQYKEAQVPLSKYYQFASVDNLTIEVSKSKKGAFESVLKSELEAAMIQFANQMAMQIWGLGDGIRGTYDGATGITAGAITLSNASDANKFTVGQTLQSVQSGSPVGALGYVQSVSASTSQIFVSATPGVGQAPATPTGWDNAGTNSLVAQGDYDNVMVGIPGWIVGGIPGQVRPAPGQSSAVNTLFGVDRSMNPDLLAGAFVDVSQYSMEEALIQFASTARQISFAKFDYIVVNPQSHRELQKELQGRRIIETYEGPTGFKYKAITLDCGEFSVGIIPDRFCPVKAAYGLDMATWKLGSAGKCGRILNYQDGIDWFRNQSQDGLTLRYGAYPALYCGKPGRNGVAKLGI